MRFGEVKWDHLRETRAMLARQGSEQTFLHNGHEYLIDAEVFSPAVFESSSWYADNMPVCAGQRFLEIGTGTGIVGIEAAFRGAHVIATDISARAVDLAERNAKRNGAYLYCMQSDVYDRLDETCDHAFDVSFWSLPFGYVLQEPDTLLERAVFDRGYSRIAEYFAGSRRYLRSGGRLLFGFSKELGSEDVLDKILDRYGYQKKLLAEASLTEMRTVDFGLYEAV
jgi:23S rRNA G2069 N7-methylase RlmK/C1962 C5-methylase RlmI